MIIHCKECNSKIYSPRSSHPMTLKITVCGVEIPYKGRGRECPVCRKIVYSNADLEYNLASYKAKIKSVMDALSVT